MDLTCPAEFDSVEVLRDSSGRAQAYLTFRNLSEHSLTELYAQVTMLDAQGASMGVRPLRYRRLQAQPNAPFTLCMVMDELPFFQDARVTIQRVGFGDGEAWTGDEASLRDCTPKMLAPGPQRVALAAIAGPDAVCWPERREDVWVCVCGRFNPRGLRTCRRCRRNREETFARYQLGPVMAQYQRQRDELVSTEREELEEAATRQRSLRTRRQADFARMLSLFKRRRLAFWMALFAGLFIAWGALSLFRQQLPPHAGFPAASTRAPTPTLQPILPPLG